MKFFFVYSFIIFNYFLFNSNEGLNKIHFGVSKGILLINFMSEVTYGHGNLPLLQAED